MEKWPGIKYNFLFKIYATVSLYWYKITVAVCQKFYHLKSLMELLFLGVVGKI